MKKKQIALVALMLSLTLGSFAQGGMQRRSVEERVKETIEKMEPLKLTADQTTQADSIFTHFYNDQQKAFEEMRSSGNMDREAMRSKRQEMMDARDAKLKALLSEDQFKKFKDEIEPAMMPQRRGGGQGGGRN